MESTRAVFALAGSAVVVALMHLSGCAAKPVERRAGGVFAGDMGGSSAVVFATPEIARTDAEAGPRWADASLNIRPVASAYDEAAWPDVRRPSLDRPRRVYFSRDVNTYTYFRTERGGSVRSERGYLFVP